MTKEEFENITIKEIVTQCRHSYNCFECPYEGNKYICLFNDTPCEWLKDYIRKDCIRKEEGH